EDGIREATVTGVQTCALPILLRRGEVEQEAGQILMFPGLLFDLPAADQERLLSLRKADSRYHKNISYRPRQDQLRGAAPDPPEEIGRASCRERGSSERCAVRG